jgi:hypothetical protein
MTPKPAPRRKPCAVIPRKQVGRRANITKVATVKRTARKSITGMCDTAFCTIRKVEPQTAQTATNAIDAIIADDFQFFNI